MKRQKKINRINEDKMDMEWTNERVVKWNEVEIEDAKSTDLKKGKDSFNQTKWRRSRHD